MATKDSISFILFSSSALILSINGCLVCLVCSNDRHFIRKWGVSSISLLHIKHIAEIYENGTVHNVWKNAGMNRIAIMKASTKAKLLSGTYILQQTQSKFKKRQISAICLMCNSDILYTSFPFLCWGSDRYQLKDRWKIIKVQNFLCI
jgi:hypothetical protein